MTLRKISVDDSVKCIPQSEQTQERDSKPKTIKRNLQTRKQDKNLSQNIKKLIENIAAEGCCIPKGIMNCYF